MIMKSAGVATGVGKAAAQTTVTGIRNGKGLTCSSSAIDTAIGAMISAVVVLLIS